jgi:hypothetical protein
VFWSIEPGGPSGEVQRWASLMAATANGPMVRRDKRPFTAADFWPKDVWDLPPEQAPKKPGGTMAPDFSHLRSMKYGKAKPPG